jgi:hypothetical protein
VDYFAPQLYWSIASPEQSYPVLLKWWAEQNVRKRHLWPGNAIIRSGRDAEEIVNQVRLTRKQAGASGNIFWSFRSLLQNRGGIVDALSKEVYAQPAIVPASTWLDSTPPAAPKLTVTDASEIMKINWEPSNTEPVWLWTLQTRAGNEWRLDVFAGRHGSAAIRNMVPDMIALTAIDRCGNASRPIILQRQAE